MRFSDLSGHEKVKKRLLQSYKENRVSHAQLFLGNTGYGSLALALAYAQYLSCTDKQEADSCGKCPSCLKMSKLVHPDLHFAYPILTSGGIENSTQLITEWRKAVLHSPYMDLEEWCSYIDGQNKQPFIGVKESAEILRKLTLTTFESPYKIMVVWLAEKLNMEAANKLLKILEEPPDNTVFLMVCEDEEQLLRTIVSRTQLVKINRFETETLQQLLVEKQQLSPEHALEISILAEGNYWVAQNLLKQEDKENWNFNFFQNWMRACLKFDYAKINECNGKFFDVKREKQKILLSYCLHLVRECLVMNYGEPSLGRITPTEKQFLQKFSPYIHKKNGVAFAQEINKAYGHIERNANAKVLFLDLSFKFNELLNIKLD